MKRIIMVGFYDNDLKELVEVLKKVEGQEDLVKHLEGLLDD